MAEESIREYFVPFAKELLACRRRDLTSVPLVCYGLPNFDSDKLNEDLFRNYIEYYVTDDKALAGTKCLGKPVFFSDVLRKRKRRKPFVIISTTVDYYPCADKLEQMGYKERRDFINMHAYKRYVFKKGDAFTNKSVASERVI